MKKTTLLSGTVSLPQNLLKKLLLSCFAMVAILSSYAANISSNAVAGNWNVGTSWVGGVVPAAGDNVTIVNGANITVTAAITQTGTITVNAGGTLTLGATLTSNGAMSVSGILIAGTNIVNGSGSFTLTSNNPTKSVLQTANPDGITTSGAIGTIQNTGARTFGQMASYVYNGTVNQVTGNGLPTAISNLTINNTGAAGNNIVSLTTTNTVITGGNGGTPGGVLTLQAGIFNIGTGNVLQFNNNSSTNGLVNNGGNLATTGTNGSDGGTVYLLTGSGSNFNITGTGTTTFYNLQVGNAPGNGNRTVVQSATSNVLINGTLTIYTQQFQWQTNAPAYGPNSTLYINTNGQTFNLQANGNANQQEWLPLASGTIGVTKGYPNNVTISNIGTSQGGYNNGNGWVSTTSWAMNGIFTLGDAVGNAQVDFSGVPSFVCSGFVLNTGSRFTAPTATMIVNGSWTDNQTVSGTTQGFFIKGTSTINFGGPGTCGAANTIQAPGAGTETFYNVGIINGTYTKLNSPVTITNNLVLTSGILGTSNPTNILSVTNSAPTAISGGGAATYIDGPVKWNLQAAAGVYNFPVGSNGVGCANDYLPFSLNKVASSAVTATVQALTPGSGGTVDATLGALSTTEYWSFATSATLSAGSTISVARPTPIAPLNAIGQSTTATGTYTSIGGTAVANGVNSSNPISTNTSLFFTLGSPPIVSTLAATSITTTSVTLNGAFNTGSSKTTSFEYGTSAIPYSNIVNSLLSPINSSTATLDSQFVTGLTANTIYHYRATDGTDSGSDVIFVTAPNPPVVGTPNTPTATGFTATWSAPAAMGSAPYTYTIQVSTDSTFSTGVTTQTLISSGSTSYTFTTLNSATQYYYRVKAVNATASSVWSATSAPISTLIVPTSNACTTGSGTSGSPGSIPFAYTLPVINGQADSIWNAIPANNISNVSVGSAQAGVSQTWKALWTNDSLYFLIQVTNPGTLISQDINPADIPAPNTGVVTPGATPGVISSGAPYPFYDFDGVEITLAPDGNISSSSYNNYNNVQFRFNLGAPTISGQSCGCTTQFSGGVFNKVAPLVDYKVVVVPGGYNVEVAIPWGKNGANPGIDSSASGGYNTPTVGNSVGLEVQVNDAPTPAGRTTQYSWANSANNAYSDPQNFALAALTQCSTPPIVVLPTVTNITANGATLGATVTSGGDATTLTARGTGITASPDTTGTADALPEGGTAISIYSGPARTGLAPQTKYYFLGYAINANNETGVSNVDSFYTLSALPATQPTLSAPACGSSTLALSWTAITFPPTSQATNTGYLLLRRQDGTNPTTTGISTRIATVQSALPSGTTLVATIPGSATTYTDATAVSGTTYNYLLVPYTWDGVTADSTYNYLTAAAPSVVAGIGGGTTPVVTIGSISSPIDLGTQIPLVGNTTVAGTVSWTVSPSAPIADTSSLSTTSTPTAINSYTYTLTVNAGGCVGSARTTVNVVNAGCLVIPNAFTPNGDGINDTWIIQSSCYTNLTVDVYDRWGSLMYHSDNYSSANAWDGKYQGKNVPDATYYYVVKATSATDSPTKKGSLTILR